MQRIRLGYQKTWTLLNGTLFDNVIESIQAA